MGRSKGKSAAKIRKKPEDGHRGRLLGDPQQKRFDTKAWGWGVGVRSITNKKTIRHHQPLLIYSFNLPSNVSRSRSATGKSNQAPRRRRPRSFCVCCCVRTSLFIVQTGYAAFPGKRTQARKQNTSSGNTLC